MDNVQVGAHTWATEDTGSEVQSQRVNLRIPLTPLAPASAVVGLASNVAVAANAGRKGLILTNTSLATISLGFGFPAVAGKGVVLLPGSSYNMNEWDFNKLVVNAISTAANSNLAVQEYS